MGMFVLETKLDPRDAFVVAVKNAFKRAELPLADRVPGKTPPDAAVIRLEMQVDGTSVLATVPPAGPQSRKEFLEENPDTLEIALGDYLVRHVRRKPN
jgi:hypothetical protein